MKIELKSIVYYLSCYKIHAQPIMIPGLRYRGSALAKIKSKNINFIPKCLKLVHYILEYLHTNGDMQSDNKQYNLLRCTKCSLKPHN